MVNLDSIKKIVLAFWKPFLGLYLLLFLCTIPFITSNDLAVDDQSRNIDYYGWKNDGRFVISAFFRLVGTITSGFYIHPLPILLGIGFLSATCLIATYILTNGKVNNTALFCSTIIAINPFMTQIFTWKFDVATMCLALLLSTCPLLLYLQLLTNNGDKRIWLITSITSTSCITLAFFSYGHATGAYIILALWLFTQGIMQKVNMKANLFALLNYAVTYLLGCIIAYVVDNFNPSIRQDLQLSNISANYLINIFHIRLVYLYNYFASIKLWELLLIVILAIFGVVTALNSRNQRSSSPPYILATIGRNIILIIAFVATSFMFCQGIFGIMDKNHERYFLSYGVFGAIVLIFISQYLYQSKNRIKFLAYTPIIYCIIVFLAYNFTFMNAYHAVAEYRDETIALIRYDIYRMNLDLNRVTVNFEVPIGASMDNILTRSANNFNREYNKPNRFDRVEGIQSLFAFLVILPGKEAEHNLFSGASCQGSQVVDTSTYIIFKNYITTDDVTNLCIRFK